LQVRQEQRALPGRQVQPEQVPELEEQPALRKQS
jgi:hypothetical protein